MATLTANRALSREIETVQAEVDPLQAELEALRRRVAQLRIERDEAISRVAVTGRADVRIKLAAMRQAA